MDAPSLAPYTAQGEGWGEGLKILSLTLLKKSGEFIVKIMNAPSPLKKQRELFKLERIKIQ